MSVYLTLVACKLSVVIPRSNHYPIRYKKNSYLHFSEKIPDSQPPVTAVWPGAYGLYVAAYIQKG